MADIISSPQISQLVTELSNMLAIPKDIASRLIMSAINNGQLVFAIPFNTDSMDLEVKTGAAASGFTKNGTGQIIKSSNTGKAGIAITAGTGAALYTVTATKTFYCTSITIGSQGAGASYTFEIRDGGIAGTIKYGGVAPIGSSGSIVLKFPTPITFTTDVFLDIGVSQTVTFGVSGWEE